MNDFISSHLARDYLDNMMNEGAKSNEETLLINASTEWYWDVWAVNRDYLATQT